MLRDVQQELHPEHIPGAGPEQDYLSRMFAPYWTHISVKYKFQLHRLYHEDEAGEDREGPEEGDERRDGHVECEEVLHRVATMRLSGESLPAASVMA